MTDTSTRRHGLEPFLVDAPAAADAGIEIRVLRDRGYINLRGDADDAGFVAQVASILGQALPLAANTMTTGSLAVYWLGPDEWLVVSPLAEKQRLVTELRDALAPVHAAVIDLSGGQVGLRISGPGARDTFAKGCTLDFHPSAFEVGTCAQSGLAKANVLLGLIDSTPTFELIVRRSFADYLLRWLRRAASDCGVSIRKK